MQNSEVESVQKQKSAVSKKLVYRAAKRAGVILDDDTLSSVCAVPGLKLPDILSAETEDTVQVRPSAQIDLTQFPDASAMTSYTKVFEKCIASFGSQQPEIAVHTLFTKFGYPALVMRNVLSREECERLIDVTETSGVLRHVSLNGYNRNMRNCFRVLVNSGSLSALVWDRVKHKLATESKECMRSVVIGADDTEPACGLEHTHGLQGQWNLAGLNTHWRLCKYEPGGHFGPHADGYYHPSDHTRSFFTFMLYLTHGFEGGSTNFMRDYSEVHKSDEGLYTAREDQITHRVKPEPGMLLVFWHNIVHEGGKVNSKPGQQKYILRSEVMYERDPSTVPVAKVSSQELQRREEFMLYYNAAKALENQRQFKQAIEFYNKAIRAHPEMAAEYQL